MPDFKPTHKLFLTGHDAIACAAASGLTLAKYADPIEGARTGLTVAEAKAVAKVDASLIHMEEKDKLLVHLDAGADGGGPAYTEQEWHSATPSDFERQSDGRWTFKGFVFNGTVEEA
jgi:hypothetical protein